MAVPTALATALELYAEVTARLDAHPSIGNGLLDLTTDEAVARIRDTVVHGLVFTAPMVAFTQFRDTLAQEAATAVAADTERIIAELCPAFDAAATAITAAAEAGLRPDHSPADVIDLGDDAVRTYRALDGDIVDTLDRIADLRLSLTTIAGIGPRDDRTEWELINEDLPRPHFVVAAFLVDAGDVETLTNAQHLYDGRVPPRYQRLGGRWLRLVANGARLRLNTGPEADAVIGAARRSESESVDAA